MLHKRQMRQTNTGYVPRKPVYPGIFRRGRKHIHPSSIPRIVVQFIILFIFVIVVLLGMFAFSAYTTYKQIADSLKPRLAALQDRKVFETSRIYDRNGVLLYEFFEKGKRTRVRYSEISPLVIQATVAIEDKTFFDNTGVDYEGIARALYQNLQVGEEASGASTITQQIIKNVILTDEERKFENRYERKFKEIILAQELNQIYTKEQILELYLNEIFYGNMAYGIEAASLVYFNTRARDLNLSQAALLCGLPQLPSRYDPMNYIQRDSQGGYIPGVLLKDGWLKPDYQLPDTIPPPKWRQIAVLRQLVEEGYVNEYDARIAAALELRFAPQEVPLHAPQFVFYIRKLLEEKYGQQLVSGGGLNIYTTLDLALQEMVQQKAAEHIASLKDRNIYNAAVVVLQPGTGQILAMVGSVDYHAVIPTKTTGETGNVLDGQVNVAVRERQPGSSLKPFTYIAAMERGMTPATILWDVPTEFLTDNGTWYAPKNYSGKWYGPMRIRVALANSLNMPAVKALKFAGVDYTLKLLDRVGIKQGLKREKGYYGLSLTLGGGEVTLLELTTAYNTLASNGRYIAPTTILKITNNEGRVLESFEYQTGQQVIYAGLDSIIVDMLSDDEARAPIWGRNSKLKLSRPAAVKTGTSEDWRDAWTLGFTPYVTVGVWSGNNNNEPTEKVESLEGGGIIWHNVMEEIFTWIDTNPKYRKIFTEPFPGRILPMNFTLDESVDRRFVCPIAGRFGGRNEELFTKEMVYGNSTMVQTGVTSKTPEDVMFRTCDAYRTITAVRVPGGGYCLPVQGQFYGPNQVQEIKFWNIPPTEPDVRVNYVWESGSAGKTAPDLPFCTEHMLEMPTPIPSNTPTPSYVSPPPMAGAMQMPGLYGLGETQARDILQGLGIKDVYVDYQTRQRIPQDFDKYPPYTVISTLPHAGNWILPGSSVILGVRAPEHIERLPSILDQSSITSPPATPFPAQPTPNSSQPSNNPTLPAPQPSEGIHTILPPVVEPTAQPTPVPSIPPKQPTPVP